ncbi:uncharacterized protein LOC128662516 isoform X2 [Bombina bombina]|uniref:uncharacterized protein LOC128662516 isoform X2 n=1 Tax=Bombina bombina TaxID=8345 RepID=UPI00235AD9A7|nr:uncharacterized protein LOC128662516 isoform X2 [Bombina bombina]
MRMRTPIRRALRDDVIMKGGAGAARCDRDDSDSAGVVERGRQSPGRGNKHKVSSGAGGKTSREPRRREELRNAEADCWGPGGPGTHTCESGEEWEGQDRARAGGKERKKYCEVYRRGANSRRAAKRVRLEENSVERPRMIRDTEGYTYVRVEEEGEDERSIRDTGNGGRSSKRAEHMSVKQVQRKGGDGTNVNMNMLQKRDKVGKVNNGAGDKEVEGSTTAPQGMAAADKEGQDGHRVSHKKHDAREQ